MSLLTIAKRVARETEENSDFSTVEGTISDYLQRIVDYINEGYKFVWNQVYKNQETDTTGSWTVSASPYDISTKGILKLLTLDINGYRPIKLIEWSEYKQICNDTTITGQPEYAAMFGNKLYLHPAPSQSYALNYSAKIAFTAMDEDSDEPLIDENLLVAYASYKVFCFDGNPRKSEALQEFMFLKDNFAGSCNKITTTPILLMPEDAL